MYESFYQLTARPFLAAPLAERYYPAASIEQARAAITSCLERGAGLAVVMGAAGTGKSMLCHVLARQLGERFAVATLASARLCTRRALLQNILYELRLPYRDREEGELRLALAEYLQSDDASGEGVLLLVDEAHTLPLRLLEEVRMITNLVRDGQPRVRVMLAANVAFDERLASPRLESFNQRIAARCYLQSMCRDETIGYVMAQLNAVGADARGLLTDAALDAVFRATDGVPRLVNQVCDHALVLAAIGQRRTIDAPGIEEAWADLQQLPVPWDGQEAGETPVGNDILEFGELDDEPVNDLGGDSAPVATPAAPDVTAGQEIDLEVTESKVSDDGEMLPFVTLHPSPRSPSHPHAAADESLAEAAAEFRPPANSAKEIELIFHGAYDPFDEPFEDEEILVDPYASLEALNTHHAAPVAEKPRDPRRSDASCGAAEVLPPPGPPAGCGPVAEPPVSAPMESVAPDDDSAGLLPSDDRDVLEIYDDTRDISVPGQETSTPPRKVRRYQHLFADLRGRTA